MDDHSAKSVDPVHEFIETELNTYQVSGDALVSAETSVRPGLAGKLAEVTAAVGRVPKNGRNEHFEYDYVTEADLVEAVRGELSSRQVALLPAAVGSERVGNLTTLHMRFTFLDGESGETLESEWFGTGEDRGDKGLYKAYTGALKYFLMKTFLIATGDDPEQSAPLAPEPPKTIAADVAAQLRDHFDAAGIKPDALKMKLGAMGVAGVSSVNGALTKLTPAQAAELDAWMVGQGVAA